MSGVGKSQWGLCCNPGSVEWGTGLRKALKSHKDEVDLCLDSLNECWVCAAISPHLLLNQLVAKTLGR